MPESAPEHPPESVDQRATWTRSLCPSCGRFPRPAHGRQLRKDAPQTDGSRIREVSYWCVRGHKWTTTWREDPA